MLAAVEAGRKTRTSALRLVRDGLQTVFAISDGLVASLAERLLTSPRRFERPGRERAVLATARPFEVEVYRAANHGLSSHGRAGPSDRDPIAARRRGSSHRSTAARATMRWSSRWSPLASRW